jgi:putative Mg2+ transporter-C (MgtC) family protein
VLNIENLYELNYLSIITRIILSLIFGGIIGLERSRKNRPAGFRTYMIVCLSATLVMMTNQFVYNTYGGTDPARLGSQVISGIGFLGAGTIIVTNRSQIRGLTTAAGLWAAACLGLAIGIVIFLIMTLFKRLDNYLTSNNKNMTIYVSFNAIEHFDDFIEFCKGLNIKINDIEINKNSNGDKAGIISILHLENKTRTSHVEIIKKLSEFEQIKHLEELY